MRDPPTLSASERCTPLTGGGGLPLEPRSVPVTSGAGPWGAGAGRECGETEREVSSTLERWSPPRRLPRCVPFGVHAELLHALRPG